MGFYIGDWILWLAILGFGFYWGYSKAIEKHIFSGNVQHHEVHEK
jgi:hypothetical protein